MLPLHYVSHQKSDFCPFTGKSCDTVRCAKRGGSVSSVPINAPTAFTPGMVSAALSAVADSWMRQDDAEIARNIFMDALVGRPLTHDCSSKMTDVSPRPAPGLLAPESIRAPPGLALVPLGLEMKQSVHPGLGRINLG